MNPREAHALHGLGNTYLTLGDKIAAEKHLQQAVLFKPGNKLFQESLKLLREEMGKTVSADDVLSVPDPDW